MEAIKDTVLSVMQGLKAQKKASSKDDPQSILKKVLSRRELKHAKANYLRAGVLGISVDSSGWLYQLNLQKEKMLDKLTKYSKIIKDIRFKIGEIE